MLPVSGVEQEQGLSLQMPAIASADFLVFGN